MADALSLLFELDAEGRPAVAEFQRVRKAFAGEIDALRKTVARSFTLPPIKLPTTPTSKAGGAQADAHVKEFKRIEAEAAKSASAQEKEQRRLNAAVESLQRQRTTALISAFKAEERAAVASAKAQERAIVAGLKAQERAAREAARAQQQAAARVLRSPQSDQQVRDFNRIEAERQKAAKASEATAAKSARAQEQAARQSSRAQEREQRRLNGTVESLQRQRSAALIRAFKEEERAAIASARAQERAAQQAARAISNAFRGIGQGLQSVGRTLTIGITVPLLALGAASLKSAKDLDANVNTLKAFTGSAESAERRLAQLIKTARGTPGLTTNLALTLDAQLRVAQTTEETINRVLPAIGRLNAVSKLPDAGRFTQNLLQLVTQNFEKQDLKELVGQSPLAGQLLTEIFNVDSPTNAKAIREQAKKLGLTTVDAFFNAFAEAAARNQGLATVTESIGTRFDKVVDRVTVALRPLGLAIITAIEPFIEPVSQLIERIGDAFNSLSQPVKTAIIVIAGLAAAAGPVLFVLGSIATAIAGVVSAIGTIAAAVTAVGLPIILAIVGAVVVEIGKWVVILGALGLAWKTNFLNIRGLVTDAASAILEAFNRIKAVFDEASQRILPTLQSITTKVLAAITLVWERYGKTVVKIVGDTFRFVVRVTEAFLRTFADFVDLILKLIDGDWRGAWQAFARIAVRAVEGLAVVFNNAEEIAFLAVKRAFQRIIRFMIAQSAAILLIGTQLGTKLITGLAAEIIKGAPRIKEALENMLVSAALTLNTTGLVAILVAKLLDAIKRASREGEKAASTGPNVGGEPVAGEGIFRKKTAKPPRPDDETSKGADAETRRRIRLLEIEAEKAEAIAQQGIAAENILFEQRRTSLREFTEFQLREERLVLEKKKAVFAAERAEAEKLTKGRDLALGEIRLKELKADLDFASKKNQILANQEREELEAAKAHRQALLDLNEQADDAELARLEDFAERGFVTAADVARRRAEIVAASFARQKEELKLQLTEAGANVQERQRIGDELDKLNKASAESVEESERDKRRAIFETAEAYRDYALAIRDALVATAAAARDAGAIALTRLSARVFLTERERIKRQFEFDKQALITEKRALALQIDAEEQAAIDKAIKAGTFNEEEKLRIEKLFHERRLAESKRFQEEKAKLEEDKKADLERADPSSGRSLFGDVFADTVGATGSTLAGFAATAGSIFSDLSAQAGNFATILTNVFSQLGDAVGTVVENFVKFGSAGVSFKKFAVDVIASVAKMAIVKSIFELAEAAAMYALFWFTGNPKFAKSGSEHLLAAAAYAAVGGVAAGVGRAVAGRSQRDNAGTASAAVNGGEPQPNNRNFDSRGQGPVETSAQSTRDGSGSGFFGGVLARIEAIQQQGLEVQRQQQLHNAQVAETLTRMRTARPGDVVTMGAPDAREAIGVAVVDHSNASGDFNETLQRNLGLA